MTVNAENDFVEISDKLKEFQCLRVMPTDLPCVMHVRMPILPWQKEDAFRERNALLTYLKSKFLSQALWLSDWANDDEPKWHILNSKSTTPSFDEEVANGAWAIFFFQKIPSHLILSSYLPSEPSDANAARKILADLGAIVGIWSWYDNYEWLLAWHCLIKGVRLD
jgi:hypothetical protein